MPALLLCYFIPALYNTFGLIDGEQSQLYFVHLALPAAGDLVLLTLSIDMPAIMRLGPKALALFLTGTIGVIIGGPLALLIVGRCHPTWWAARCGAAWPLLPARGSAAARIRRR